MIQRFNTANKSHQRKYLSGLLSKSNLAKGSRVLDFGCGTGLFAKTFRKHDLDYYGYDIDKIYIRYAKKLYRDCIFTTSMKELQTQSPFDLIVANCCFHHIRDAELLEELDKIKNLLDHNGKFIVIDILAVKDDPSYTHRLFTKLERGKHVRFEYQYKNIIEQRFSINRCSAYRTFLFSLGWNWFPLYTDLVVLECTK